MILSEDSILRKVIVQICADDNVIGSGCIVPSAQDGLFYCLTAWHCVEKGEITLHQLTDSGEALPLKYDKHIMDDGVDAAVLWLSESCDDYPRDRVFIGKTNPMSNQSTIALVGYPEKRKGAFASYRVDVHHKDTVGKGAIYFNLQNTNPYVTNLYEQIAGISGGGCFSLDNGAQYKLLGIETGFVDKEQTFGELIGLDLSVFERLLADNQWPPLARPRYWYASHTWKDGRNVLDHSLEHGWVDTQPSRPLVEGIQNHFLSESNDPLLVSGFSGSGKTTTVLRACTENPELSNAIIFQSYQQFSEAFNSGLFQYCRSAVDEPVYLIVDDVTINEWYTLKQDIKPCPNIHVVAVAELGLEQDRRDLNMLRMEPCGQEDVMAIIRNAHPSLDEEESLAIYRLSRNDLRFALLIAYMYEQAPDRLEWDMQHLSSDSTSASLIVNKIMSQVSDLTKNDAVKIFSLFIDFGYIGAGETELNFLSNYFNIKRTKLERAIKTCLNHQLGIKRGNYFELSPRAFARLLFAEYSDDLIEDISCFMDQIPTDLLRERFLTRARECGENTWKEVQGALSSWFQEKYQHTAWAKSSSIYGGVAFEPSIGREGLFPVKEAMTIVEFLPEVGLPWLKQLIFSAGGTVLDAFGKYSRERQEFVWTCEHLACFAEYFDICEAILFEMALHEADFSLSNNSRGTWTGLFALLSSNTEVSFRDRFQLLLRHMGSFLNDWPEQMFQSALNIALSWSGTSLLPPKMIGGRLTPESWEKQNIETMQDLIEVHTWMMNQLHAADELPKTMRQIVFDCLKTHMVDYTNLSIVRFAPELLGAYCQALEQYAETSDQRTEIVIAIDAQLDWQRRMDSRNGANEQISQVRITFLEQWRIRLADNSYISRLNIMLAKNIFRNSEQVEAELAQLTAELLSYNDSAQILNEILSRCSLANYSFTRFATAVGKADISGKLLPEARRLFALGDSAFSENYFYGVCDREKGLPDFVRNILEECTVCAPKNVLHISIVFDQSSSGLNRICHLLQQGIMDNSVLDMSNRKWSQFLSLEQAKDILTLLIKNNSNDSQYYFLYVGCEWIKTFQQFEFAQFVLDCMATIPSERLRQHSHPFILMLEQMPEQLLWSCLTLVIHSLDYSNKLAYLTDHIGYIQKHATGPYASDIASEVCNTIYSDSEHTRYGISCSTLISILCPQSVLHWINSGAHPEQLAEFIAYHLPAPSLKKPFVPIVTQNVLDQFEHNETVFQRFCMGIHNYEVCSYEKVGQKRETTFALLEQYNQHPSKSIRRWADYERDRINRITEIQRQLEAEDARFQDF